VSVTLQEDQIGVAIEVGLVASDGVTALDLTNVSTVTFVFLDPDGIRTEKTGTVNGDPLNGDVAYVLVSGDLNKPGGWKFQIKLTFPGQTLYSEVGKIKVHANI